MSVTPASDTTYTVTCTNTEGSDSDASTVTVTESGVTADPPTLSFDPELWLSWLATDAISCTASGDWSGAKAATGSEMLALVAGDNAFTLTCEGPEGSVARTIQASISESTTGPKFTAGERVQTTDALNVRSAADLASTLLGTQPAGALGTVLSGPVSADGYSWYEIDYDAAPDGWSASDWLE